MPKPIPPPLSLTLTILRVARGWTQGELARASGIPQTVLSDYEVGRRPFSREKLESFVEILGLGPEAVDAALEFLDLLRTRDGTRRAAHLGPEDLREIDRASAMVGRAATEAAREDLTRILQVARAEQARREALEAWERLKAFSPRDRRRLVDGAPEYQTWALCELLCAESKRAAASNPRHAIELAELALRVADLITGEEIWRVRLQGYALAHRGNARRVADDVDGAEADFQRARDLWLAGAAGEPDLLDQGMVPDLESSLRKDQRRFSEALSLQEEAVALAGPECLGDILLNLASTLEQMGDYARSVEILERASHHVDPRRTPRSFFGLRFNLAVSLSQLGRFEEAEALMPEVRERAVQLRNELDLLRVRWLEGRIAAGQGRRAEAIKALSHVWMEFSSRGVAYDAALSSLELAVLYLEEGQTGEVRVLAREMAPVFKAQGVHREALAALRLFCEAAERESVTLAMARRLLDYLQQARQNPEIRFA